MNNKKSSIDGFIPRRPGSQIGERHFETTSRTPVGRKQLKSEADLQGAPIGVPRRGKEMTSSAPASNPVRSDIDDSLRELDEPHEQPSKKMSRRDKRRLKKEHRTRKQKIRRRIIFTIVWLLMATLVAVGVFVAYKAISAGGKVLQGNIFDIVQNQPLKKDENGRSNFLVFGTAEDDEGGKHGGANLTDSIMVVSVDQEKKDAYMLSLPRDLWVSYQMPAGEACTVGYQGKLNAQYFCASNDGQDEKAGAEALGKKVGEITGLDVQYYVHLNFTAVVEAVNAVGGVDVTINSSDPRGILDRNFDWKCGYRCYFVNYRNGEKVHLDGEHALALARARNAAGGYGVGDNFGREQNQQMIIKALLEKAVSAGTLTNLGAVTGLIDAMGNNLRTNIETKEVRTLMDFGTKIPGDRIVSLSLVEEGNMLVTTGNYNGQSIVRPIAGFTEYRDIRAYVDRELSSDPFVKEEPHLTILNGSGEAGAAQTLADKLTDKGFVIDAVDNAPDGTYQAIEIYQVNAKKTATAAKLKELYNTTIKTTAPPVSVTGETDFVIIVGDASVAR